MLGLRADPLSIHIEARRSLFAKHLMDLVAEGSEDAINAGEVIDLHECKAIIAGLHRLRMFLSAA